MFPMKYGCIFFIHFRRLRGLDPVKPLGLLTIMIPAIQRGIMVYNKYYAVKLAKFFVIAGDWSASEQWLPLRMLYKICELVNVICKIATIAYRTEL